MSVSRRDVMKGIGALPIAASVPNGAGGTERTVASIQLPDRTNFAFEGVNLNAAYTHVLGKPAQAAALAYLNSRMNDSSVNWPEPEANARDRAVSLYANLINAAPADIAVVPSTLEGENLIAAALDLGVGRGVVTDQLHYSAALAMYGERSKAGMPLTILRPRDWRIDYAELDRAITSETRLVALSLISSATGFKHDLKRVCEIAHAKGALVYADVIQAAGADPFDVQDSGVDFCCAGMYKWLMGEFGAAFLYVRPDRLRDLRRVQIGWRGLKSFKLLQLPFDPPAPSSATWELRSDTASHFEVSTANWGGLATTVGSLEYITAIGVDAITRHRRPLLDHLERAMLRAGYELLTPSGWQGTSLSFAKEGIGPGYHDKLRKAKIFTTLYKNRIRISPSVYNNHDDIDALLSIISGNV